MQKPQFRELIAFAEVARQRSFARAAAVLGISPSTLSQSLRSLEEKLEVRLLNRTTRSVSLTEAGEHLLLELDPILSGLDSALDGLTRFRGRPRGRLRLLAGRAAAALVVAPLLPEFFATYPDIELELLVEDGHIDLVEQRIDAGIQIGEQIAKDMIVMRLMPPFSLVPAATPTYLERHGTPQTPADLRRHACIRQRSGWDGAVHPWHLERGEERVTISVDGPLVVNDLRVLADVVAGGAGIGLLPIGVNGLPAEGTPVLRVLDGWVSPVSGLYLYHPSRRQIPAPLRAFMEFMRGRRLVPRLERLMIGM